MISVIIHNSLAACLKAELEPVLPFYKTSLNETKICSLGFIGNKKTVGMPINFLQTKAGVSLNIDHQEEKNEEPDSSMSEVIWPCRSFFTASLSPSKSIFT